MNIISFLHQTLNACSMLGSGLHYIIRSAERAETPYSVTEISIKINFKFWTTSFLPHLRLVPKLLSSSERVQILYSISNFLHGLLPYFALPYTHHEYIFSRDKLEQRRMLSRCPSYPTGCVLVVEDSPVSRPLSELFKDLFNFLNFI